MNKKVFERVELSWNGGTYTIEPDEILGAIAVVEEHVTLKELYDDQNGRNTVRLAKLAGAFHALLTYAGVRGETKETVYEKLFEGGGAKAGAVMTALLSMMVPRSVRESAKKEAEGNRAPVVTPS